VFPNNLNPQLHRSGVNAILTSPRLGVCTARLKRVRGERTLRKSRARMQIKSGFFFIEMKNNYSFKIDQYIFNRKVNQQ